MKNKVLTLAALLLAAMTMTAAERVLSFKLSTANGLPDNNIRAIAQDSTGYLYLHSRYATYRYDGYGFRTVPDSLFDTIAKSQHQSDERDNLGNPYGVGDNGDVVYTDRRTGERLTFHVFDPQLRTLTHNIKVHIVSDGKGHLWISTNGNGLWLYDRRTRAMRHIVRDDDERLIDSNYIVAIFLDHKGNVWVSQEHYGLACLRIVDAGRYVSPCGSGGKEQSHNVRMLRRVGKNRLLMADNDGTLYESDGNLGHIHTLKSHGDNFLTAFTDRSGRLWLGSRLRGINVDSHWTGSRRIDCIIQDRQGRIWACGVRNDVMMVGDGRQNTGDRRIRHFFSKDIAPRQMVVDHWGNIWLASDSGLYVFNPDRLTRDPNAYTRVDSRRAKNVFVDSHRTLWVGTAGSGVLFGKAGAKGKVSLKAITRAQGLPSNVVQFVAEDRNHNIIIGTENGYAWYSPANGRLRPVIIPGNTVRNYCNENSFAILNNGDVAVGTLYDIVVADRPGAKDHNSPRNIAITDILVNGTSFTPTGEGLGGALTLPHDQNSITFNFSTFDFGSTHDIAYSYKLEGYDRDWSVPSDLNMASYKNLPPGHYTFLLRYRTANGDWAGSKQPLDITIRSPWWATWWAITLYVLIALAIGYVVLRQLKKMNELRQNVAVEKQLTDYKLRFFTNISHEFRTPLTLIQGAMERIRSIKDMPGDMKQPVSNMQRSVDRMMRLVNQLLEFRKMQNGKLSLALQETDVVAFIYNIYMNFHDVAENRNITYLFVPQRKSLMAYVDRGHLDKIVYNLLSNAFKYTPKGGEITIRVASSLNPLSKGEESDYCQGNGVTESTSSAKHISPSPLERGLRGEATIVVSDTGIGISKDKQAEIFDRYTTGKVNADSIGIGLNLTKELVRVHHGDISYSDTPGGGSTFTVTLPLDKDVYAPSDFMIVKEELDSGDEGRKEGFDTSYKEAAPEPMNDKTVLVVEDNPDIAEMLQHELGRYFHVVTAMDGEEAYASLKNKEERIRNTVSDNGISGDGRQETGDSQMLQGNLGDRIQETGDSQMLQGNLGDGIQETGDSQMLKDNRQANVSLQPPASSLQESNHKAQSSKLKAQSKEAQSSKLKAQSKEAQISLVVSDVMMPGMNGFELVKKIRGDERLQHLPIILLTALSSDDKQEHGLDVGADAYIAKPFSMKVLIAQCASLIHQREVLQNSYAKLPQKKEKAPVVIKDEKDKKFIEQLDTILESHLGDAGLSVDDLADRFGMGRTTFYRKVRELTGKTPNAYLSEKRMYKAADMLRTETNVTVAEVAYAVGITTPQYFATAFKKMFGVSPSEYQKGK